MRHPVVTVVALLLGAWGISMVTGVSVWLVGLGVIPILTVLALVGGRTSSLVDRTAARRAGAHARLEAGSATARNFRHGVGGGDHIGGV